MNGVIVDVCQQAVQRAARGDTALHHRNTLLRDFSRVGQLLLQPLDGQQRETWRMIEMWIAAGLSYSSASISVKGSSAEERTGTKDGSARSASALRSARIRTEVAPPDRNLGLNRALADLRQRQALIRDGTALHQLTRHCNSPSLCFSAPRDQKVRDCMAYLLGIDGGTESIRAMVFDLDGRPTGSHASAYQTQFPKPSWAEQNPEDWWRCLGEAARGALKASGISADQVIALCIDTTCCSVVAVDAEGTPLRPAMIWMDVRSAAEAADVAATGDPALRINSDGRGPVSAEWMIPKSLWMKRNQPELFARPRASASIRTTSTGA